MEKTRVKIIIGLGNPEEKFFKTKHNLGYFLVNSLSRKWQEEEKFAYAKLGKLILILPRIFVNQSGTAVKEALKKFKIKPKELLVVHDEADLQFPYIKLSFGKSSAGHKGVESIIKSLKTEKFWRLRIGIQGKKRIKAMEIVLKKLTKKEWEHLNKKMKRKFKGLIEKLKDQSPTKLNLPRDYFL